LKALVLVIPVLLVEAGQILEAAVAEAAAAIHVVVDALGHAVVVAVADALLLALIAVLVVVIRHARIVVNLDVVIAVERLAHLHVLTTV
jgi:hypothetical protein